jgi:DNA-binding LacI/PurR family transcriptional regulator
LPDAILVANDQMALGVMRACAEKGIAIPGQISVVGLTIRPTAPGFPRR